MTHTYLITTPQGELIPSPIKSAGGFVYTITFTHKSFKGGYFVYIGCTSDFNSRKANHSSMIRQGYHTCKKIRELIKLCPNAEASFDLQHVFPTLEEAKKCEQLYLSQPKLPDNLLNSRKPILAKPRKNTRTNAKTRKILITTCLKTGFQRLFRSVNELACELQCESSNVYKHLKHQLKSVCNHSVKQFATPQDAMAYVLEFNAA